MVVPKLVDLVENSQKQNEDDDGFHIAGVL